MNKDFRIILIILILLSSYTSVFGATKYSTNPDECIDGVCYIPQQEDDGNQVYPVVSPVGYHDVEKKAENNKEAGKKSANSKRPQKNSKTMKK